MSQDKRIKCELYNDNFQNYKSYNIPAKAQLVIADVPYCYDIETECWTTNGWKKYNEITMDDTVMSINPETLEIEYSGIKAIIIRENTEDMVAIKSSNLDLFVTANHRMFAYHKYTTRSKAGYVTRINKPNKGITLAKDIGPTYFIPRKGYSYISKSAIKSITIPECDNCENIDKPIPLEDWLPFFGLWLADGCTCNFRASNGRQLYTVSIKQAGNNRDAVEKILSRLPFKYHRYDENKRDESNFNIYSKQLWFYLQQFGKAAEKFIPRWILDLPTEYLKLFWNGYVFGDSCKNGPGLKISSISKELVDNLQEIALKLGCLCQARKQEHKAWKNPLYYFQYNPNSKNIGYSRRRFVRGYKGKVWCITCATNSVFLVRRNGKIAFSGNCIGNLAYGSNPSWYIGGDNANGESKLAGKSFFRTDNNFNIAEYFHFCARLLKKEPKERNQAPAMIVFCSWQQIPLVQKYGEKHGFKKSYPIYFIKKSSSQALKANMKIVGGTETAMVLYRDKLPKFRNKWHEEEFGKKMILNWFNYPTDNRKIYPKCHPTQKPVELLKQLIQTFTDPGDIVIDPCAGSGSTLRAAYELGRSSYGFEVDKGFYKQAKELMLNPELMPVTLMN